MIEKSLSVRFDGPPITPEMHRLQEIMNAEVRRVLDSRARLREAAIVGYLIATGLPLSALQLNERHDGSFFIGPRRVFAGPQGDEWTTKRKRKPIPRPGRLTTGSKSTPVVSFRVSADGAQGGSQGGETSRPHADSSHTRRSRSSSGGWRRGDGQAHPFPVDLWIIIVIVDIHGL